MTIDVDVSPFRDFIEDRMVYGWTDKLGRKWLANGAWSWFRVYRK